MQTSKRIGRKFLLLIVLPFALSASGILWTTVDMLGAISTGANNRDHDRTSQAVTSAFTSIERHLAGLILDNAFWDEASKQAYGLIDDEWMFDTWGVSTKDQINYDVAFVLESDGRLVTGYRVGERFVGSPEDYLNGVLPRVLAALPLDASGFASVTTLLNTPDGLAALVAGPILPTSADLHIPVSRPRVLVFVEWLTPELLTNLGKQYVIANLAVAPATQTAHSGQTLRDRWGSAVANVTWQDRRPGDAALRAYGIGAYITLFGLLGVMLLTSLVTWRVMRKLAAGERSALHAARHDALSGLPNRTAIVEKLALALDSDKAARVAVLYVDLDGFKNVNDTFDHETGDKLICAVAAGFTQLIGERGTLARLGGDEFGILLTEHRPTQLADAVAKDLLAFLEKPFNIGGRIASVGASVGVVVVGDEEVDAAEVMRRADLAMYNAKDTGRNRHCFFDKILDKARADDLSIAAELREMVRNERIEVAYQPVVDAHTQEIVGVEALARWSSESSRCVTPDKFIAIAEEHGIIDALGEIVLRIACRNAARWPSLGLAVNVSPVQLNNPNFISAVQSIVQECGFDLNRLELEITEGYLIRNPEGAKRVIDGLRACGVSVALDDFGSGYSSVGYLRQFSFDKVKLDRSLTSAILGDSTSCKIVQGTVLLASGLGVAITAEGVETVEEVEFMRLAGCDQLQGYYFGKPRPAAGIDSLIAVAAEESQVWQRRSAASGA